ncbi:MAG: PDZ domain-containing protein, partial [Sedimenticolaceae bacterium]
AQGRYIRPSLGISIDANINQVITEQLGVSGVAVLQVQSGSAAEAAGLRSTRVDADGEVIPGDVILAVAGIRVDSIPDLLSALDKQRIGDEVALRIWRDGRELQVSVVLQAG